MAADASEVLGSPQVAGTFLSPKGMTKKMSTASAGRMVGGVVGSVAAGLATTGKKDGDTPTFGQIGYLAVTAGEVALVRGKVGALKPKIRDEVLGRKPRSEVQHVEFDKGTLKGALNIQFADGAVWEFEIPKVHRKTTERVVQELTPG
ncbi:MAG: hypothetical protein ACXVRG_00955 [Gaiellaceae bacterium]